MMACGGWTLQASGDGKADADVQRNVPDDGDANPAFLHASHRLLVWFLNAKLVSASASAFLSAWDAQLALLYKSILILQVLSQIQLAANHQKQGERHGFCLVALLGLRPLTP